jgi:hypothetical protein
MTYAELEPGTIFRFVSEPDNVYEKVGPAHYRKGIWEINFVCLPITNHPLGANEQVVIVPPDSTRFRAYLVKRQLNS